ncbi:MAG: flp pilus-assembly TadE/G-like family protein [bacterium]|nr:flp pilus-assembly TadE/G-like family protein [bacterium]
MPRRWRCLRGERGSATVTGLATIAAMLIVLSGLLLVAGTMAARSQAQTAADLGALAAAQALQRSGAPCTVAGGVVRANGGEVSECAVAGEEVVVTARVPVRWLGRTAGFHSVASARAGPGG